MADLTMEVIDLNRNDFSISRQIILYRVICVSDQVMRRFTHFFDDILCFSSENQFKTPTLIVFSEISSAVRKKIVKKPFNHIISE